MANPPDEYVDAWTLRDLFNNGEYYERMQQGEFNIITRKRPASEKYRKLFGEHTLSVKTVARDRETDTVVFKTHHFESPDGNMLHCDIVTGVVTPTGRMDPKRVFHDGKVYHLDEEAE